MFLPVENYRFKILGKTNDSQRRTLHLIHIESLKSGVIEDFDRAGEINGLARRA